MIRMIHVLIGSSLNKKNIEIEIISRSYDNIPDMEYAFI